MKALRTLAVSLVLLAASQCFAGTIYNNTSTDTFVTYFYSGGSLSQIGDSITLGGTERTLTDASIQFFNNGSAGTFSATLSFWNVGGPVGAQIGSSYVLNGLSINATDILTVTFSGLNLAVPNNIIFTVAISNMTTGMDLGLNAFEPPSIGSSNSSSLITATGSTFSAGTTGAGLGNLYLQLEAIPEPTTISMFGGAAVLALFAARKRER